MKRPTTLEEAEYLVKSIRFRIRCLPVGSKYWGVMTANLNEAKRYVEELTHV